MGIKLRLIDNDYVVCADTDLELRDEENEFRKLSAVISLDETGE